MKAFFPIVGEKEYKDSTLRTEQRQCVFTKLRIESVFISFVSFSFNKPHVSVPTRTCIRVWDPCAKWIRVIRVITSLRSVGLRRISCSKHLVRASKFIIGQFHIAASRNNSTFNIQNSTLRSAPPCAKKYSWHSLYYLPTVSGPSANLVFKKNTEWHPCSKISCSPCERTA